MDLLGSILNSMEKPPSASTERNKMMQKQKKIMEKQQAAQKAKLNSFREKIEKEINEFIQDSQKQKHKFAPMDKVYRNIVHDVADIAGLCAFAFGEEEVDRYVMIFKKEHAPSDEELAAYRKGVEYDPQKAKELALQKEKERLQELEESKTRKQQAGPVNNYAAKYEKLVGSDAGIAAAKIATPNKQFGFVNSEQKKDKRSIEQTLADIQAKKKLKKSNEDKETQNKDD
ncbi:sperm-associated antigen 7 homolog isoform X1 [Parasteatoda tepidariorum]|uniref:sperm-associated antigen 7 homolog isoform X1 n=2 Tax=Parasteatoda tepidariorum TaxID=114398 RepID=UPI00077F8907|nr:sperm-associated antigen 7 homolog isoform X1 [Parasteatoda tepidariorum]